MNHTMASTKNVLKCWAVFLVILCGVGTLRAAEVHKCIIDGRTTYQSQSCPSTAGSQPQIAERLSKARSEQARPPLQSSTSNAAKVPPSSNTVTPSVTTPKSQFRCDGRTRCTQMRSCAEATFFLRNCPGVQIDGDHDGIPCEEQWCQ